MDEDAEAAALAAQAAEVAEDRQAQLDEAARAAAERLEEAWQPAESLDDVREAHEAMDEANEAAQAAQDYADAHPDVVFELPIANVPEGYDPDAAQRRAQEVSNHLKNKGYSYSRRILAAWQRAAGMVDDGIFGPATRDALKYFNAANVPQPLFRKRSDGSYIRDDDPDAQYQPPA